MLQCSIKEIQTSSRAKTSWNINSYFFREENKHEKLDFAALGVRAMSSKEAIMAPWPFSVKASQMHFRSLDGKRNWDFAGSSKNIAFLGVVPPTFFPAWP